MKLIKILMPVILIAVTVNNYSATTIQAGGFSFTPNSVTVNVGDTINFVWINGTHTTTSVSVPANAVAWDAPLDNIHTSFTYVVMAPGTYNFQCNFHVLMGMTGTIIVNPTGIIPVSGSVPDKFSLKQNYPNPFNPVTTIKFDIAKNSAVKLRLFNVQGEEATTLVSRELQPGSYSVDWNASNYASGIYYYRLEATGFSDTKKLMLVK